MFLREATHSFLQGYFSTCERSPKTIAAYRSDLEQFLQSQPASKELAAFSPEDLEAWALELKRRELAPASLRRKLAVVKIFFQYWVRRRELDRSPFWLLRFDVGRVKPLTRTLTRVEMMRLLAQAELAHGEHETAHPPDASARFLAIRNRALVELLFATGIRVGEASALRVQDVSLDQRTLLIRGKGGRQRLALLTDEASFAALSRYCRERASAWPETSALWLNRLGGPLSTQGIAAVIRNLARAGGLERPVTPHMLRHTSATMLLQNGADLRIVQEFLGHASITTTQRYTHITRAHLQATLQRCHPRMGLMG